MLSHETIKDLTPNLQLEVFKSSMLISLEIISELLDKTRTLNAELEKWPDILERNNVSTIEDVQVCFPFLFQQYTRSKDASEYNVQDVLNWIQLVHNFYSYVASNININSLRKRQATVFDDIAGFIVRGGTHGHVLLPTGAGKTVLFVKLTEALNQKTLIVVPTTNLLDQTAKEIGTHAPSLEYGKVYHTQKEYGKDVTIITYDSLRIGLQNGKIKPTDYKVLILDEAHMSIGPATQEVINKFQKGNTIILEFTATDEFSETKRLFSEPIHRMSIVEGVEERLLAPISCVLAHVDIDLSNVKIEGYSYNEDSFHRSVQEGGINTSVVNFYKENFNGEIVIIFVSNIDHGDELEDAFNDEFGFGFATSLNGYTQEPELIIQNLDAGNTKIVIGVDKLATGFNYPRASVCFNIVPTKSKVRATQRAGRVTRLDLTDPQKVATIVDFVYPDNRNPRHILYPEILGSAQVKPKSGSERLHAAHPSNITYDDTYDYYDDCITPNNFDKPLRQYN